MEAIKIKMTLDSVKMYARMFEQIIENRNYIEAKDRTNLLVLEIIDVLRVKFSEKLIKRHKDEYNITFTPIHALAWWLAYERGFIEPLDKYEANILRIHGNKIHQLTS